jgi:muramoyltetrapeptide carboxypeptidase
MTLGVVAPSSPVRERSGIARGAAALQQRGYRLVFGPHTRDVHGYLAGNDADRADDLLTMFERDDVDAVICLSGGYGAMRTALAIDHNRLRRLADSRVKPFIGYSDITVLHALLQRELGWTTFYGPMVSSFAHATPYTTAAFDAALGSTLPFDVLPDPDDPYVETLVPGRAEGRLMGGCLSLVASLMGTPWELDLRGSIFFFEDIHEAPYGIDRFLTQLIAAGKLAECAGIVVGEHVDCKPRVGGNSLGLEDVFDELLRPLGIPTLYHLPIGHGRHLATLPLGVRVELDATAQRLRILESGVN